MYKNQENSESSSDSETSHSEGELEIKINELNRQQQEQQEPNEGYISDLDKIERDRRVKAIQDEGSKQPYSEPKLKGIFRCQLTNEAGETKPWEERYVDLSRGGLVMKESPDDRIVRGNLHLYDIVFIDIADDIVEQLKHAYVVRLRTRARSSWVFVLDSQSTLDEWIELISTNKGKMSEDEWKTPLPSSPSSPYKPQKDTYTLKTFIENRRILGGMWMIYLFFLYTIVLVVLFVCLWKLYVVPFKDMETMDTMCLVKSQEAIYKLKKNYNLRMDVEYLVNGTVVNSVMNQLCQGIKCPDYMVDHYPLNQYTKCYYDVDDTDFVFFEKQPMMNMRYQITFGVCGGLLAPWLIFVVTMLIVQRKWMKRVIKNGCW